MKKYILFINPREKLLKVIMDYLIKRIKVQNT